MNIGKDCIQSAVIFDVQWSNCPVEVEEEVKSMWRSDDRLYNDVSYYNWDSDEGDGENYPLIDEYLKSRGVTKCLIHWWW